MIRFPMPLNRPFYYLLAITLWTGIPALQAQNKSLKDSGVIFSLLTQAQAAIDTSPSRAFSLLTDALEKSRQSGYTKGVVATLTHTAEWYFANDIDKAIQYGNQALQLYEAEGLNDINLKAPIDLLLGEAYDEKGKRDSSAYYYYRLSDEIENGSIQDAAFEINTYVKLIVFWGHLNYDTASIKYTTRQYIQKAATIANRLPATDNVRNGLYFLQGLYYHSAKQFDSARYYFEQYLTMTKSLKLPRKIATYLNIADTYLMENRPAEALPYIERIRVLRNNPDYNVSLAFFLATADFMRASAFFQQQKYTEVISILNDYLYGGNRHVKLRSPDAVDAHRMLATCYEKLGQYKKAVEQNNIHIELHDSLVQKDKLEMINRLEMRFRIAQKDKELAVQKLTISEAQSNMRKKNFWIGIISLIAVGLAAIFMLWRRNSLHKQKLQQEKINGFQQQMEITRLNATISGEEQERKRLARELHDGIGGLLAASRINFELAGKKQQIREERDFAGGLKLLEEASVELRKTAHNMLPDVLENKGLQQAIRSFCNKMGHNSSTEFIFQHYGTEKKFNTIFELGVYRVVQELVHNILKHAQAKTAVVQMEYTNNGLTITIEDDGIGMPESNAEKPHGIGLTNIFDRVKSAGGTIDIESNPNHGTSIYLEYEMPPEPTNNL